MADKKHLSDEERLPELFNEAPSIDRSKCKREVPMKVLVLGLVRTGTACMNQTRFRPVFLAHAL
jgi:hypothetical protein